MATAILVASNTFLSTTTLRKQLNLCKAISTGESSSSSSVASAGSAIVTERGLSISLASSFVFSLVGGSCSLNKANAAILEADDDMELLERVKKDRQKRLEKHIVISSSKKETGISPRIGVQAEQSWTSDSNDFPTANSVLGDKDWVQKANLALNKLSSSPEEKTDVDAFNSSLASLISSVTKNDAESSKLAFVSSASAFEKWTALTGLTGQLKGL